MRTRGRASVAAGIALAAWVLGAGAAWAQSQPKWPEKLPLPKAAPAAPVGQPAAAEPARAPAASEAPAAAAGGRRDPFDPLVRKPAPGDDKRLQEISGLRLVGVVWDPRSPGTIRALVETPDGLGYYLRVNEQKFGGTVVAVERDRVQFSIREEVPGGSGRVRTVELRLVKPDGQQ